MASPLSFLNLPRELRDMIYHDYVLADNGYHYDYNSGKLRMCNGAPIDLAFMYTCKIVAAEMRHLPLQINVVRFSTACAGSERITLGLFDALCDTACGCKVKALKSMAQTAKLQAHLTPEIEARLIVKFPQYKTLIRLWRNWGDDWFEFRGGLFELRYGGERWGEARSSYREFIDNVFDILSENIAFRQAVIDTGHESAAAAEEPHCTGCLKSGPWNMTRSAPWDIPSERLVAELRQHGKLSYDVNHLVHRVKWRFSAAALAIRFLHAIPLETRKMLKHLFLHEDLPAAAHPECHSRGLIPYCLENSSLRIERHVDIWSCLMLYSKCEELRSLLDREDDVWCTVRFPSFEVTQSFQGWIVEASALEAAGMPSGSFSLVLDGHPDPDNIANVFERVVQDASWARVHDEWWANQMDDSSESEKLLLDYKRRVIGSGRPERFPIIIADIIEGKSCIRCDFPVRECYFESTVRQMTVGLTPLDRRWNINWATFDRHGLETPPTLPPWREYRYTRFLPEDPDQWDSHEAWVKSILDNLPIV